MNILPSLSAVTLAAFALAIPANASAPRHIAGGSYQKASVEGCTNQWLFNGVWRMRVTSVEPITDGSWAGYGVNVVFRNGTHNVVELGNTGVQGEGDGVELIMDDGNPLKINDLDYQRIGYRDVVQGGSVSGQIKYHFPAGASTSAKPVKFVLQIDPHTSGKAHYSMPDPSFRVDLRCTK